MRTKAYTAYFHLVTALFKCFTIYLNQKSFNKKTSYLNFCITYEHTNKFYIIELMYS